MLSCIIPASIADQTGLVAINNADDVERSNPHTDSLEGCGTPA
ncbi:MAG: hypothetical protein AAF327_22405 [Cyanobacteria bacterium P01_A01_bin.37]